MSKPVSVAVYFAGREINTTAEVEYYSQRERMQKAAIAFGICMVVALVFIPVPAVHFVISPLAVLMGPISAALVYFKTEKLPKKLDGEITCGHCAALTRFHFAQQKPPLFSICESCKTGYEVVWPPREAQALS